MPGSIQQACLFFNIEPEKFNRIHTKALKIRHLHYLYMRKEFEIVLNNLANNNSGAQHIEIEQAKALRDVLLNSSIVAEHIDKYSANSVGLLELDTRSHSNQSLEESSQNSTNMSESVISIAPKTSGVEPGFKAFEVEDVMLYVWDKFPEEKYETERLAFIKSYAADPKKIYTAHEAEINMHLVKLTYTHMTTNNKLIPNLEDLRRTGAIKNIQKNLGSAVATVAAYGYQFIKTRSSEKINVEAALEVLANDIARVAGMHVQVQYLYRGVYPNGGVQFKLKAIYLRDVRELGPLKGGSNSDNGNYCYRQALFDSNVYLSDHSIKNFAENLPLLIVQCDRDAIGSKGQNKMRTKDRLIGIDFGHAYSEEQSLLVRYDFSFNEPKFKNYSVFYDARRSSIMRGLLKIARLHGENIPDDILKSYGHDFYTEIKNIQPHSDETIFTDYINKFAEIANEFNKNSYDKHCLTEMHEVVKRAQERHIRNRKLLVEQFRSYLNIEKQVIDIAENIEKVFCGRNNTSLRSQDGSVLLQHLRIINSNVCNLKFLTRNDDEYQIQFIFKNGGEAEKALKELNTWLQNYSATNTKFNLNDEFLMVTFKKADLIYINKIFSEEIIKEKFHRVDNKLFNQYQLELEIQALIQQLSNYVLSFEFAKNKDTQGYQLKFKTEETLLCKGIVSDFAEIFSGKVLPENKYCIEFSADDLNNVYKILLAIPTRHERELNIQRKSEDLYLTIATIQKEVQELHLFSFIRQDNNFTLDIRGNNVFKAIFLQALKFSYISDETCQFTYEQLEEVNQALITAFNDYCQIKEKVSQSKKPESQTDSIQAIMDTIRICYDDKDIKNNIELIFDHKNEQFFTFKIICEFNHRFVVLLRERLNFQAFAMKESGEYLIPVDKGEQLSKVLSNCYLDYCIDLNDYHDLNEDNELSPSMRF